MPPLSQDYGDAFRSARRGRDGIFAHGGLDLAKLEAHREEVPPPPGVASVLLKIVAGVSRGAVNKYCVFSRRCVVVDCGSGSTRAMMFATECSGGKKVRLVCGPVRINTRVGDALSGDADVFARELHAAVSVFEGFDGRAVPVYTTATAGARAALRQVSRTAATTGKKNIAPAAGGGDAAAMAEERLRAALAGRFPRSAFAVLDGATEARYEFAAVKYALESVGAPQRGVFSGGGMSMQLVDADAARARSLDLDSYTFELQALSSFLNWCVPSFVRLLGLTRHDEKERERKLCAYARARA